MCSVCYTKEVISGTILFFVFVLGTIIGSFLNVLIVRYNTGLGLLRRSFCFSCERELSWYELIPIVSFFLQKGRCRRCGAKISWQYPLVEIVTGILFVLVFLKFGFSFYHLLPITYHLLIFSLLIAIAFYDIRHKIIPDSFVYVFIALSFFGIFIIHSSTDSVNSLQASSLQVIHNSEFITTAVGGGPLKAVIQNLIAGPVLALPLVFLWLVSSGKWMGLGDGKLMLGIGWFLGLGEGVVALFLSFWIGALFGIGALLSRLTHLLSKNKSLTIKGEIPFAPFLVAGALIVFFLNISFSDLQNLFLLPL